MGCGSPAARTPWPPLLSPVPAQNWFMPPKEATLRQTCYAAPISSSFALENNHFAWKETAIDGSDGFERAGCSHCRTNLPAND